jgi:hypothetical protein
MKWLALSVALLMPYVAGAFETGDRVVCTRSCEIKTGDKTIGTLLPGDAFAVAAEKAGLVQDSQRGGGWVRADCLIAEKDAVAHFRKQIATDPDDVESERPLPRPLRKLVNSEKRPSYSAESFRMRRKPTSKLPARGWNSTKPASPTGRRRSSGKEPC